jgi:hypothetical protein
MRKILTVVLFILLLFGISFKSVVAAPVPTPTPTPSNISSFELFWPIVAGKTMGDLFYFIKTLKEDLRGVLIFGAAQKADYSVFLATKRVVEIEKLILESKVDLAGKTIVQATWQIDKATSYVDKVLSEKVSFQEQSVDMVNKLSNLESFIPELILKAGENREALNMLLGKITSLKAKLP